MEHHAHGDCNLDPCNPEPDIWIEVGVGVTATYLLNNVKSLKLKWLSPLVKWFFGLHSEKFQLFGQQTLLR